MPDERARDDEDLERKELRFSTTHNGFNVHCAVRVEAGDDVRRERLIRYCPDIRAVPVASDDPTKISAAHWSRILDGELDAASSRIAWAVVLRRTHGVDSLCGPRCADRMRVMATLTEPGAVTKSLAHLGLPTEPLPRARAHDPTGQASFDVDAA